jgi:hypothetical protein
VIKDAVHETVAAPLVIVETLTFPGAPGAAVTTNETNDEVDVALATSPE